MKKFLCITFAILSLCFVLTGCTIQGSVLQPKIYSGEIADFAASTIYNLRSGRTKNFTQVKKICKNDSELLDIISNLESLTTQCSDVENKLIYAIDCFYGLESQQLYSFVTYNENQAVTYEYVVKKTTDTTINGKSYKVIEVNESYNNSSTKFIYNVRSTGENIYEVSTGSQNNVNYTVQYLKNKSYLKISQNYKAMEYSTEYCVDQNDKILYRRKYGTKMIIDILIGFSSVDMRINLAVQKTPTSIMSSVNFFAEDFNYGQFATAGNATNAYDLIFNFTGEKPEENFANFSLATSTIDIEGIMAGE